MGFPMAVNDATFKRFLKRLPDDIQASFTAEQCEAIRAALQVTQWRRHPIDIRVSIPLLWKSFYFVLILGPERRSRQRRTHERTRNPVWTPVNVLFTLLLVGSGVLASFGLLQLKSLVATGDITKTQVFPTAVPFKETQTDCEASERIWKNGECLDFIHDPNF